MASSGRHPVRLACMTVLILTVAVGSGLHAARAAFPRRLIEEPVFGLVFAPDKARFDTLGLSELPEPCRAPLLAEYVPQARFLVYADQAFSGARYLVLGDRTEGALLAIRAGKCDRFGVLPGLLHRSPQSLKLEGAVDMPPEDIRKVFADVLARYTRAFGGKQRFFAWLDTMTGAMRARCADTPQADCSPTWHTLPADLQAMLEASRHN